MAANSSSFRRREAIKRATDLYRQRVLEGVDMSSGPCLSDEVVPDWCVDVAHNPRQPVDDLPENQCSTFREGRVHHFVELDTQGNLIRAR
ncbi:MAG: hypothetical protein M1401_05585 [Chloroflexi bacterium]|nr:hypothetical protein [Chloroflexota bacterium]MCL5108323.1 hypothetical protein [Chloroflexota bacterium]MDA8218259.1 hypothetical protein [Dehalococcoidales bacterium]